MNKANISAEIIADSITKGSRIITFMLSYPRFIHSEIIRHRKFAHSVNSSRAVSLKRNIEFLEKNSFTPIFTYEQAGMIDGGEVDDDNDAPWQWKRARQEAIIQASYLHSLDIHHSISNRLLEPFLPVRHIMTGSYDSWQHFISLRSHPSAEIHARVLSDEIDKKIKESNSVEKNFHLPFNNENDENLINKAIDSIARCARISYINYKLNKDFEQNLEFVQKLWSNNHVSPFEHIAFSFDTSMRSLRDLRLNLMYDSNNLNNAEWASLRHFMEQERYFIKRNESEAYKLINIINES